MKHRGDGCAGVLAQAEELHFEAERRRLEWLDARAQREQVLREQHRNRLQFLKANAAVPLDVIDYERWLTAYVNAGGALACYQSGTYPRPMDQQPTPLFQQLVQQLAVDAGSLEHDYFSANVIWSITTPVALDALPALDPGLSLSLHLTQKALELFDSAQLLAKEPQGSGLHIYLDGYWRAGQWHEAACAWNVEATVWAENLANFRATAAQELGELHD